MSNFADGEMNTIGLDTRSVKVVTIINESKVGLTQLRVKARTERMKLGLFEGGNGSLLLAD